MATSTAPTWAPLEPTLGIVGGSRQRTGWRARVGSDNGATSVCGHVHRTTRAARGCAARWARYLNSELSS